MFRELLTALKLLQILEDKLKFLEFLKIFLFGHDMICFYCNIVSLFQVLYFISINKNLGQNKKGDMIVPLIITLKHVSVSELDKANQN